MSIFFSATLYRFLQDLAFLTVFFIFSCESKEFDNFSPMKVGICSSQNFLLHSGLFLFPKSAIVTFGEKGESR